MNLSRQIVRTLFTADLRMVLRDRRILLTSILLPILIMPLMLAGSHWTVKRRETRLRETTYRFAIDGRDTEAVREYFSLRDKQFTKAPALVAADSRPQPKFEEVQCEDPLQALQEDKVDVVLEGATAASLVEGTNNSSLVRLNSSSTGEHKKTVKSRSPRQKAPPIADDDAEGAVPGAPMIRIIFRADRDLSSTAATKAGEALREARRARRVELLK